MAIKLGNSVKKNAFFLDNFNIILKLVIIISSNVHKSMEGPNYFNFKEMNYSLHCYSVL